MSLQTISSNSPSRIINELQAYSYSTKYGKMFFGDSLDILNSIPDDAIDLLITSPPFALQRKKEYGNKEQHEYIEWLSMYAHLAYRKLKSTGSLVIDLGGAYQKGIPVRSLYNFRLPIKLCDEMGFFLAEEFFWYNPSKLPSPIEWVNKRKIRAKDSVNTVWWFSKTEWPKADIRKVLTPYSDRMLKLIENPEKYYRAKERPSGHNIGTSFGNDNGGAIPSNLLQIPNSESNSLYLRRCKSANVKGHPARFPEKLPEFFIKFLTDENDLVVDVFAGSNTTGFVSEKYKRFWISIDNVIDYVASSSFRFLPMDCNETKVVEIYQNILNGRKEKIKSGNQFEMFD